MDGPDICKPLEKDWKPGDPNDKGCLGTVEKNSYVLCKKNEQGEQNNASDNGNRPGGIQVSLNIFIFVH